MRAASAPMTGGVVPIARRGLVVCARAASSRGAMFLAPLPRVGTIPADLRFARRASGASRFDGASANSDPRVFGLLGLVVDLSRERAEFGVGGELVGSLACEACTVTGVSALLSVAVVLNRLEQKVGGAGVTATRNVLSASRIYQALSWTVARVRDRPTISDKRRVDPAAFEGLLQLGELWTHHKAGAMQSLARMGSMVVHHLESIPERLRSAFRARQTEKGTLFDFILATEEGDLVAELREVQFDAPGA